MKRQRIAVLGATGNVGREILTLIKERKIPYSEIYALSSPGSTGKAVSFGSERLEVINAETFDFSKVDVACFAVCSLLSKQYYHKASAAGCIVIDNSSAFRMEEGVPLVVADVNLDDIKKYKNKGIIANPNCVTSPLVMALKPLEEYKVKRVVASTYQSVSGAGKSAMDELYARTKSFYEIAISGKNITDKTGREIFTKDIAFNCIPRIDVFLEGGRTKEEWKMEVETQKILNNKDIKIAATCVRVPVFVGHSISVAIEFEKPFDFEEVEEKIASQEGIVMLDRRESGGYATPRDVVRTTGVFISRVRRDESVQNGILLWITSDNVYGVGAAYNVVRILEELIKII